MAIVAMTPRRRLLLLGCLLAVVAARAQEPNDLDFLEEPAARQPFDAKDFTATFAEPAVQTPVGDIRPFFVKQAPALATLPGEGVSQALVTLKPCGMNQPHSHPRGTEVAFVVKGALSFAFLEENPTPYKAGGRQLAANLTAGQTLVVPQGLIHWATNWDCKEDAQFVASFPTRDPGTQTTMSSLFADNVDDAVLRATTGLDNDTIKKIREGVKANKNPSADPKCLEYCKLSAYPPPPPEGNYQSPPPEYQSPPPQGNYQTPPPEYQTPPPKGNYQTPPPQGNYQTPPPEYQNPPPEQGNYGRRR